MSQRSAVGLARWRGRPWPELTTSLLAAVLVLGPMLRVGYPLRYDLVSVPSPAFNPDTFGRGDGAPRSVPLDFFVASVAHVFPAAWLTQALALLALVAAGTGVAALLPGRPAARVLAAFAAVWNPFVMEQLAIGHVPHLLAYGALPWIGRLLFTWIDAGRPAALAAALLVSVVGSLTPGGGCLCLLTAACCSLALPRSRRAVLRAAAATLVVLLVQAPWILAGFRGGSTVLGRADQAAGIELFSIRSETGWGKIISAAGLGGMWNQNALPTSRSTVLAQLSCVLFVVGSLLGAFGLARARQVAPRFAVAAILTAGIAFVIAVFPALPDGTNLLLDAVRRFPALALVRDGHRWLAPLAVVEAVCLGALADLPGPSPPRVAWAKSTFVAALIVACLPDMIWGLGGRLRAWEYPPQWQRVARRINASPGAGNVLILPWSSFRDFRWTDGQTSLDPMPRLLRKRSIVSHVLIVSGYSLPQEGPLARRVDADLLDGRLSDDELRALDVSWIVVERQTAGSLPQLPSDWKDVLSAASLRLLQAPPGT